MPTQKLDADAERKWRRFVTDEKCQNSRFSMELEFMSLLANPRYLHHLAVSGTLDDERFLRFLRYLEYWRRPEYACFVRHAHAFHFLTLLLESRAFRLQLRDENFVEQLHQTQYFHWRDNATQQHTLLKQRQEQKQEQQREEQAAASVSSTLGKSKTGLLRVTTIEQEAALQREQQLRAKEALAQQKREQAQPEARVMPALPQVRTANELALHAEHRMLRRQRH
ncbi:MAG: hypothetical protein MHM6MM_006509 [Cercozoa sp. M6MM]